MNESEALIRRVPQEAILPEEMLAERSRVLEEHHLVLETIFDTFKKESGKKDVVSARTEDGDRVIVRLGERRPSWLFPNGFVGTSIRIPHLIASGGGRIPFEIEEAIGGTMMDELDRATESTGQLSDATLQKLAAAFWEFQQVGATLPLESMQPTAKIDDFLARIEAHISPAIGELIKRNRGLFEAEYPSKWKFATDNLILDENDRVAFIDNVKVGKRYFGYDLGWIIWPPWLHMSTEAYADVDGHLAYLDHAKSIFFADIPDTVDHPADLGLAFNLIVLERLIGSLFDVAQNTKHLPASGLDAEHSDRLNAHKTFLHAMLERVSSRLS